MYKLGTILRELRNDKKLTLKDVGKKLNISIQMLSRIELNKNFVLSIRKAFRQLSTCMNIPPTYQKGGHVPENQVGLSHQEADNLIYPVRESEKLNKYLKKNIDNDPIINIPTTKKLNIKINKPTELEKDIEAVNEGVKDILG